MIPAFRIKIGNQINKNFVTVGNFDGSNPSLAIGTTGGKILLHSPHEGSSGNEGNLPHIRYLNFNSKITALASGKLVEDGPRDLLYVGTQSTLLAYDVERNADVFFRDVPDGVNSLAVGSLANMKPLLFAGGNCSIVGFNEAGTESFWTVTGDNVSALCLSDVNNDGLNELIVGSEDFEIRTFRNEELISEQTEADKIIDIKRVEGRKFAYSLSNGTVGVYDGPQRRLWRVKTKNKVTAIASYDINADGVPEIISTWSNQTLNIRNTLNGETIYKTAVPNNETVAAIVCSDYRKDGKEELMLCCSNGDIIAYLPAEFDMVSMGGGREDDTHIGSDSGVNTSAANLQDQKTLESLQAKKQELANELKLIEKSLKNVKTGDVQPGALPPDTVLSIAISPDPTGHCVLLTVSSTTEVQISAVIVIDLEGILSKESEIVTVTPLVPTKEVRVSLRPTRNAICPVRVQTHISARGFTSNLHVFEETVVLPKFASLVQLSDASSIKAPTSSVSFVFNDDIARFSEWLNSCFIISTPIKVSRDKFKMYFKTAFKPYSGNELSGNEKENYIVQAGVPLILSVTSEESVLSVQIRCDDMDLTADLVQDIAKFFKINELESTVNFPAEMQAFEEVLKRVAEFNSLRVKMSADMAEDSQRVKALIVRAEDSRLMVDMETMRRAYTDLFSLNNQLIVGYNNRASNHEGLLVALKEVNQMIQRAANLRVGNAKTRVINDCRGAVKSNNMSALFRIIRQGYDNIAQNTGKK